MASIQSMNPVQFPRMKDKDEDRTEYDTAISQNENNLNQNFSILYQALEDILSYLEGR